MSLNRVAECVILLMQLRMCARKHAVISRPTRAEMCRDERGTRCRQRALLFWPRAVWRRDPDTRGYSLTGPSQKGQIGAVLVLKTTQNDPCENMEACTDCKAPLIECMLKHALMMSQRVRKPPAICFCLLTNTRKVKQKHQVQHEVMLAFILKNSLPKE